MEDTQLIEILGRHRLIDELVRAGLEVAEPIRDRGIDLLVYADHDAKVSQFAARPIQMKAASQRCFSLDRKYTKFPNLLLAYVWHLANADQVETYAMTFPEALQLMEAMGYADSPTWKNEGRYANTRPGKHLCDLLMPYQMTPAKWWERVVQ